MKLTKTMRIWRDMQRLAADLLRDRRAMAAVEFAFIVPVMLVMLFGTIEFSSAIAIDRKVTLMARTLSDLTSQAAVVSNNDLTNFFAASTAIMTPYPTTSMTTLKTTITQIYIDSTKTAKVKWSQGSVPLKDPITVPTTLAVADTYLIFSQVSYNYIPAIGYVLAPTGITMSDSAYTRPRQSKCVNYPDSSNGC